jgi:hypothetical protein
MRLACGYTNDTKHISCFELITANRLHGARSMTTWTKGQCNVCYDTKNISTFFALLFGFGDNLLQKEFSTYSGLSIVSVTSRVGNRWPNNRVRIPASGKICLRFLHSFQSGPEAHPPSYSAGAVAHSSACKAARTWRRLTLFHLGAEAKNYGLNLPASFMAWRIVTLGKAVLLPSPITAMKSHCHNAECNITTFS